MFGGFNDSYPQPNSFYQKLDKIEKACRQASSSFVKEDWGGESGWEGDQIGLQSDTLNDGMHDKLKKASLEHDYGAVRQEDDYSFRPDTTFTSGTQYKLQVKHTFFMVECNTQWIKIMFLQAVRF